MGTYCQWEGDTTGMRLGGEKRQQQKADSSFLHTSITFFFMDLHQLHPAARFLRSLQLPWQPLSFAASYSLQSSGRACCACHRSTAGLWKWAELRNYWNKFPFVPARWKSCSVAFSLALANGRNEVRACREKELSAPFRQMPPIHSRCCFKVTVP